MPDPSPTELEPLLRALAERGVDYIVVGMVSAVIRGAPIATFDLDIVYARSEANIERALRALDDVGAYVREQHGRRLTVDASHLATTGHKLLKTRHGRLDLLGAIGEGEDYDALLPESDVFELDGLRLRVLKLEKYIALKEQAGRAKDLAVLPMLRALLEITAEGGDQT